MLVILSSLNSFITQGPPPWLITEQCLIMQRYLGQIFTSPRFCEGGKGWGSVTDHGRGSTAGCQLKKSLSEELFGFFS